MSTKRIVGYVILSAVVVSCHVWAQGGKGGSGPFSTYYDPYGNNPPGAPPNYNLVDSSYFQGVPALPEPLTNDAGGYYIFNDTAEGKWYIANYLYSRGNSLEQFHGSILATLDQAPAEGVNIWIQGFELSGDLKQNDRWGWIKWPDSIAPNLYEIWWDITIDYAKPKDTGDFRDTLGVTVAGCAIDFNLWSSGHGDPFGTDQIYLGDDMLPLSDVSGFVDTYAGITDQYQVNDPDEDPNTSRFTSKALPGETYNANGLITTGTTYGNRYAGSWAYEGNGVQFATLFCPPTQPPNFVTPAEDDTVFVSLCAGGTIYDTLTATDPNPEDTLSMVQLSGPGFFSSVPSVSPVTGYFDFTPVASGIYTMVYEVSDGTGEADTVTVVYDLTINTAPVVELPWDTSIFLCGPAEICLPVDITDNDCDVTSVSTNTGSYTGTMSNFDQVSRINDLGGSITQVGGGAPGTILYSASDFVPPVNSQSGVSVVLPNFVHADIVIDNGSFPTGLEPDNSVDHLLYAPTDLTFTVPGSGGPDGGSGDGSVAFAANDYCEVGFSQDITSCHGANSDFVIFTNTNGGGTADIWFKLNGSIVHSLTMVVPGGSASSGIGGITLDLPDGITFNSVRVRGVSGTLEIDGYAARTTASPTLTDVCFDADTSGFYEIIVSATDSCGNVGADTTLVTVTMNTPPIADAGSDINTFQCNLSEICFNVSFTDIDNNLALTEKIMGPGTLSGSEICFTPPAVGAYTFVIHAIDSCGEQDYDTVVVTVDTNDPPIATNPTPVTLSLCDVTELCYDFTATDPNGGVLTWTHIGGVGSITPDGHFCFTPTVSGTYGAAVIVNDSCGAVDTTTISYTITVNSAPVAVDPGPAVDRFLCESEEICYQFSATDAQGNSLSWSMLSGDGSLTAGGLWCFTPTASGSFTLTAAVADSCGLADTVSHTFNVTLNEPPTIALGADTAYLLCDSQEICLSYTVGDPQGSNGLVETMESGFGSIDTSSNEICFTPTTEGIYEFIVSVADSCGAGDVDTINVIITFGEQASIACPTEPIDVFLCTADQVCHMLDISPATASVTTSYGIYSNGELCFQADTSGTYTITVIASESCSNDTCEITFNIEIGSAANITCPAPQDIFLCGADTVCLPVSINGSGVSVTVNPIGAYAGGNVCFPADTSGHYEIEVIASTSCGTDTCTILADIELNSAPVADEPVSPVDTALCVAGQICYQFSANDVDGQSLTWSRISGHGTVNGSGLWCFNANASGTFTVTAKVTDSCGAADTVSLTYNVTINGAPTLALGPDTTLFMCSAGLACLTYSLTDPNNNVDTVEILSGDPSGYINLGNNQVCFNPVTEGDYTFVVRTVDSCGAQDVDTLTVTVDVNEAPIVDAGSDLTIFQCNIAEICWSASVSDPDGNLVSAELVSGPGTFDGSQICFTPTISLDYEFVLKGADVCGEEVFDTVVVHYTLNTPPVADAGEDQTLFLCSPTEICWDASCSDADGNLASCALIEGPGTYDGSQICFTPGANGSYSFVLAASDACGATHVDTVKIDVTINSGPVCTVPNDTLIFQCAAQEICLPAFGSDVDGNLKVCQITSGPGTLSAGNWCFTPMSDQTATVTIRCEDSCGAICESEFTIEIDVNSPPQISFGNDTSVTLCTAAEVCLPYIATDPDDPRPTTLSLASGAGVLDEPNSRVCFVPDTSGLYMFVIRNEDECGEFDEDTINVNAIVNGPPVADAGTDQTLFLCDTTQVCWPATCTDPDGNLSDCIFDGPGLYTGSQICFTPTSSGQYVFTLHAIDECGEEDFDTVTVDVTINSDPVLAFGGDTSLVLCSSEEICLDYTVDDADGLGGLTEVMLSGFGAIDTAANQICFTPTSDGAFEFVVRVTDSCGAYWQDTIVVNVTLDEAPVITCPASTIDKFLCGPDSVSRTLNITPASATVSVSYGTYSGGTLAFWVDTAGTYTITVIASTLCGADTCELTFNVSFNSPPVANAGSDQSIFQCAPAQICWAASCSDPDGNLATCQLESGPGTYNGSSICFTPSGAGSYQFVLLATDDCGVETRDTVTIDVTTNSSPTVAAQADTSLFLCAAQEVCVTYTPDDPDGLTGLLETMVSGFGSIDTAGNQICFTPTSSGSYEFIVQVSDPCGASDEDTVLVEITIGEMATITCPTDTIIASLCDTATVCTMLDIEPAGATVTTSYGTYAAGELCIFADTSGTYAVQVIATTACGSDTCEVVFDINIGQTADITCPAPLTRFVCDAGDEVCVPVTVMTPGATITVSPIGYYNAGNVCFPADTSGHYELSIVASTPCGTDSCDIIADITVNSLPVAVDPTTPVDTFLCVPGQICSQFSASDVDGGQPNWTKLSGVGTVSATGQWCFNANSDNSFSVTAVVTDSCGAADTVSLTYNVTINSAPVVSVPNDTGISICDGDTYCFPYTVSDDDNNVVLEELLAAVGSIDTTANEICFTPASSGAYQFVVQATDECGDVHADTVVITVTLNSGVTVTCPADTTMFLCTPGQICQLVNVSLPGADVSVSPIGTYDQGSGEVSFDADTAGLYVIEVIASSTCGADTCQFSVDVTLNSNPIAVDPATRADTFICANDQICFQFEADDPDNDTLTWSRLSGAGTVNASGLWCFTTTGAGSYTVAAVVSDPCGASDTTTLTYNVTINSAPVLAHDTDLVFFLCTAQEICVNYYVGDTDDNAVLEEFVSGDATIDTLNNDICITPDTTGTYQVVYQVTDACGAVDIDTVNIGVVFNQPPVANAGADQTLFQCDAGQVCWPASCTDPNSNLDTCFLNGSLGTYNGTNICFTPDTAGTYTFVLTAIDLCGIADVDTVSVTVSVNSAPICQVPSDTAFFQCNPTQVTLPVGADDPDGNLDHCEIVNGPGSIVNGNWVYTPSTDESLLVKIMCLDSCGEVCEDSFTVAFDINAAPVVDVGSDTAYFLCNPQLLCRPATVSDEDGNLDTAEVLSPDGAYLDGSGNLCYSLPAGDSTYTFVVKATDTCGAMKFDTSRVTIEYNSPPSMNLPPNFTAYLDMVGQLCFDIEPSDPDDNLTGVSVAPIGTYSASTGQICFNADSTGTYCLEITVRDGCGAEIVDTICVEVVIDECLHVQIEKTHGTYQGQIETVTIYQQGSGKELGGYEFLIAYDATALTINNVHVGSILEDCGWEYFTYRHGDNGNCGSGCPTGLLRIVALAETNNGAYHPGCYLDGMVGALASIDFMVTNDATFECQYVPVRFFWLDCADNTFSSKSGDTLWLSRNVFDFELNDITNNSYGFPGYYGAPNFCLEGGGPGKPAPIRCVDFTNGGIDIVCADSIDARGDLNLNSVANEIADAVLYSNYFVYGLGVFTINSAGQIAASDVNADGLSLTVADLVYLIRVVTGDAIPYPKLDPNGTYEVDFDVQHGVLSINSSDYRVGAIFLTLDGEVEPTLHADAEQMEIRRNFDGEKTRVLIYNMSGDAYLEIGNVLNLNGNHRIKEIEIGSYEGYVLKANLNTLPSEFSLSQNYPNPFNPVTSIEFGLPFETDWELSIYNILGQEVERFSGEDDAGYMQIEWDAGRYASGVYFYRLRAADFSDSKKMVFIK